jgi:hypothetical protein
MTKTELRLQLVQRQRRFEWQLARDDMTRAAAQFVRGKTHDLLNLVQIVKLAGHALVSRCGPQAQELVDDMNRAGVDAERELKELMAVARPEVTIDRGAPVGAVCDAAISTLRPLLDLDVHLATPPDTATRLTAEELEHLLIGLALEVAHQRVELTVRERTIDKAPWIEIVRGTPPDSASDAFERRAVEAIAQRAGGEVATAERRDGGEELVVALPVVR